MRLILILICLIASAGIFAQPASQLRPRVITNKGQVEGTTAASGINVFKGIPFAQPPVNDLRWKAPLPMEPWKGVKRCDHFGPSPMQGDPVPFSMWSKEFLIPDTPISEDCLYLNIWTKSKSGKDKLPVLVWIYGGGFMSGGSGVPIYDGEAMAKRGIVFVSINYRVGIFGFFAAQGLTEESDHHASGNYGLLDQVAALKWVHENIAAFGGDPDKVTIAGQSAGSMSVNCLVASPLSKGLFRAAIGESGASIASRLPSLSEAEAEGSRIMQKLNVSSVNELRNIPADKLMKQNRSINGPIVDGYVLPQSVKAIYAAAGENKVNLLTGWNQDEGLLFGPEQSATQFKTALQQRYDSLAGDLLEYYPASNDAEAHQAQLDLSRDEIFGAGNYAWANATTGQDGNVYVYRFVRKPPAEGQYKKYGAFHTGEVPYAYDNLRFVNRPWEAADRKLAAIMSDYWANFIITGNPNGQGLPHWPAYLIPQRMVMLLDESPGAVTLPERKALDLLLLARDKAPN